MARKGTADVHIQEPLDTTGGSGAGANVVLTAPIPLPVLVYNALIKYQHDYIDATFTGGNLTSAVFKDGGAGGTVVGTITITYDGNGDMDDVTVT